MAKADIVTDATQTVAVVATPRAEETPVAVAADAPTGTEPELIRKAKADAEEEEK